VTRVLVVEDEESFSDALSYMLRREGYEVDVAATGPEALTSFERSGADLVLLDLMLPGLSGTEVCRELRTRSHVPIIMVTARDTEVDKVVGLELGADDYVTSRFRRASSSPGSAPCSGAAPSRRSCSPAPSKPVGSAWTSNGTWCPSRACRYPCR
jgi:CheY-like chemotaxis protein